MEQENRQRRSFLKQIFAGSAAVTAVAAGQKEARAADETKERHSQETLYRESDEFKKYYHSLRS